MLVAIYNDLYMYVESYTPLPNASDDMHMFSDHITKNWMYVFTYI